MTELDERMYELLLVGMYRHNECVSGSGFTILRPITGALSKVTCYREIVSHKWSNKAGLATLVSTRSKHARRSTYTVASRFEVSAELREVQDEHFILLVSPQQRVAKGAQSDLFDYSRVLGPGGYSALLTTPGLRAAEELIAKYPLLDLRQYKAGKDRFNALQPYQKRYL